MENGVLNTNGKTKRWKKILYEDSGYPDNFTPEESFLAAIEKNKNVRLYEFQECLLGAAVVGQVNSIGCFGSLKLGSFYVSKPLQHSTFPSLTLDTIVTPPNRNAAALYSILF